MISHSGVGLRAVRRMLEGVIPPAMCSVSAEGVPHVNYVSHVEFVDDEHVALTYQFLNQSRANVLATRRVALSVDDPYTCAGVVLHMEYLRTDTEGPIFERLRVKLAGIAAHSGMEKVFNLRGADVYRVHEVVELDDMATLPAAPMRCDIAVGTRALSRRLADATDLPEVLDGLIAGLQAHLCIDNALLWLLDEDRRNLVLVASAGYPQSGVGAELALDDAGLAAVAIREGVPIRIGHMAQMNRYGQAWRRRVEELGLSGALDREVPLPGLAMPRSQMAVPLRAAGHTIGALLVESDCDQFFSYDDEDALALLGAQLAQVLLAHRAADVDEGETDRVVRHVSSDGEGDPAAIRVRHFAVDDSVFIDDHYLIKGVAGAILWKLVCTFARDGRSAFTSRELRLAGSELRLPELQDNLSVRLLLLERRLAERRTGILVARTGRGRFRLVVERPLHLTAGEAGD